MMKQSIFYGLDADQVSKNEALRYFDIENMRQEKSRLITMYTVLCCW